MKKKLLVMFTVTTLLSCATHSKYQDDILYSKDIKEIEHYLKNSHPQDPKRSVLKPKLIALKNKEWTKGAATAVPMKARPLDTNNPQSLTYNSEDFNNIYTLSEQEKKDKSLSLLNNLFNTDISNKEAILLFKNNSDCNLILRISGKKFYNLAVPSHNYNSIVVEKDNYLIEGSICDAQYSSRHNITKSLQIELSNPSALPKEHNPIKKVQQKKVIKRKTSSKTKKK